MIDQGRWQAYLDGLAELSARECTVLELMAGGLSNDAISRQLVVSIKTVETHIAHIYLKLGLMPGGRTHRRVVAAVVFEQDRRLARGDLRPLTLVA